MFQTLFHYPKVRARHEHSPLATERRAYLSHLADLGSPKSTLRKWANELLVVCRELGLCAPRTVSPLQIRHAAQRWAERQRRRGRARKRQWAQTLFVQTATAWLKFSGRLHERPIRTEVSQPWMDRFVVHLEDAGKAPTTRTNYCWQVRHFLHWWKGQRRPLRQLRLGDLDRYFQHLSRRGWGRFQSDAVILKAFGRSVGAQALHRIGRRQVKSYLDGAGSVTTFWHRKWTSLRGFYRFALARRWVGQSPLPTTPPKVSAPFVPYIFSRAELKRLLTGNGRGTSAQPVPEASLRMLLSLLYGAGLRLSEALRLEFADVDWETGVLTIRDTKFFKTRWVPLAPALADRLRHHLRYQRRLRPGHDPTAPALINRAGRAPDSQPSPNHIPTPARAPANPAIRRNSAAATAARLAAQLCGPSAHPMLPPRGRGATTAPRFIDLFGAS